MDPQIASAWDAYEHLAPVYDDFSADYDHGKWLDRLERVATERGLQGKRLLDVACGTGKSFEPLLRRGYEVTACDLSPAMIAKAREKRLTDRHRVFVADMRRLPGFGQFDLVTCLDDAVNYLLRDIDLASTFRSVSRLLADGGIYVFDTNTLRTYRTDFADSDEFTSAGRGFRWTGQGSARARAGSLSSALVEADRESGGAVIATHVQRHHPVQVVRALLEAAGLKLEAVLGQSTGCVLDRELHELTHTKAVYVARKPTA